MSSPAQVSQYGPYIDLQNFTGSAAPGTSGSFWLSGSNAGETLYANVGLNVAGTLTGDTSLTLDSTTLTTAELAVLDSVTAGTAAASKAVVLDGSKNIATIGTIGCGAITSTGASTMGSLNVGGTLACDTSFTIDSTVLNATELGYVDGVTAGTAAASKAVVLDANGAVGTITHLTATYAHIEFLDVNEINSVTRTDTTLEVVDKLIIAASGSNSANSADGGLQIGGTNGSDTVASVLYDHANVALDFNIGGTTEIRLEDGKLLPQADSDVDLGSATLQWKDIHADAGYIDAITVTGTSTLTTVDINGGAIDGTAIGASSQSTAKFTTISGSGAVTLASTLTVQGNILPLADNGCDLGASGTEFKDAFFDGTVTTDALVADTADINGGSIDGAVIGASSAAAGTFAALVGTSLNLSEGNITNAGDINCDTISVDDAAVGLQIQFGGATTTNKIVLTDNLAEALTIEQGGNDYLKFVTTDNQEYMSAHKEMAFGAGASIAANQNLSFGNDSSDPDGKVNFVGNKLILSGGAGGMSFSGSVVPSADASWDLGSSTLEWKDLYIDGTANIDSLVADTADIDGGTVDGVVIGGASAGAGTFTTLDCTNGAFALDNLDIDGATDIGAALATTDLLVVDDGAGGTNRKSTFARVVTLMESEIDALGAVTFSGAVTVGSNGSGYDFKLFGAAANEYVLYDASEHTMQWVDSGGAAHVTIGGDATSEYAVDVVQGSNNKNKIRAASFVTYSDERLKSDVSPMRNALETVNSLNAVDFTWNTDGSRDFGFLAQDLKKAVPQAVHGTDEGLLGVDYGRLTAVLVSAIQEQSAQIKDLQAKLNKK
jgi:hypothetical protein